MKRYVIHLLAFQGAGKLTIAKEINKKDNSFFIFHNHLVNDCIFPFGKEKFFSDQNTWGAIYKIKNIIFDYIENHGREDQSFIFTNAIFSNCENGGYEAFETVRNFAERIGAIYIPVRLICDAEENKKRMMSEDRKKFHKTTDATVIDKCVKNKYEVLHTDNKNELTIDITNLKPEEVAEIVMKHCCKL